MRYEKSQQVFEQHAHDLRVALTAVEAVLTRCEDENVHQSHMAANWSIRNDLYWARLAIWKSLASAANATHNFEEAEERREYVERVRYVPPDEEVNDG